MAIADRIAKFFVADGDLSITGERRPVTSAENRVTHLIDGSSYFGALRTEVTALTTPGAGGQFFYFTNWVLMLTTFNGTPTVGGLPSAWEERVGTQEFHLDDSSGAAFPPFLDELAAMAANGVDVRALPWVSPHVLTVHQAAEKEGRYNNYAASLLSVKALRAKPGMERSACLNLLAHPLGAMHLKVIICGDNTAARAYVSGIDFQPGRVDARNHPHGNTLGGGYGWHDIGVRLEGPAVDSVYAAYQRMWNEQISRDPERFRFGDDVVVSHDEEFEPVEDRTWLPIAGATRHVQVLRTLPRMNLAFGSTPAVPVNCLFKAIAGFSRPALSYAPDGIFEFRPALRKAIAAADSYIYVEDQAFTGRETMKWVHDRLVAKPDLKAIFVYGGDPTDPPEVLRLLNMAVNEHLAPAGPAISDRIAFYFRTDGVVVHSKTWIIDDEFAIVGSANAMRRSLYTDGELSVSVLDENDGSGSFAVDFRADLWAEHCGVLDAAGRAAFTDLNRAIKIWDATWSVTGAAAAPSGTLRPFLVRKRVPFTQGGAPDQFPSPIEPVNDEQRAAAETSYATSDGDSREAY